MQNYVKITAQQLEDFMVNECVNLKQKGLTHTTRDYLWNRAVSEFGTPLDANGDPIGPGGQVITRQLSDNTARRIAGVYKPSKSRNVRSKFIF